MRKTMLGLAATLLVALSGVGVAVAGPGDEHGRDGRRADDAATATPIKHLVVIFQENVSFDHYFGTYPHAANAPGEPSFTPAPGAPTVNGLSPALLTHNPNSANPQRLDRSEPLTCDQGHGYKQEQQAFDSGLMDKFVPFTDVESCAPPDIAKPGLVMDYYDGNTVTGMWNYAQHFALSDNSYDTVFGPSTPGALNLISGQTHGFAQTSSAVTANGTVIGDPQPTGDTCDTRDSSTSVDSANRNIGDLLNAKSVSWGWFSGGFRDCNASHANVGGGTSKDYIPHHEPFQYYASTANPQHLPPTSVGAIGHTDQANHQYDLADFWAAAGAGDLPAVSFLKAAAFQDGHAGYSDPLDEQHFLVDTINRLERLPSWRNTAVVIAYDDSDGWYDHQMGPIVSHSSDPANDALAGPGLCGTAPAGAYQDRCGYGPRLPLLVISPYARQNFVDNSVTDQSSILRFIEDNWNTGRIGNQSFDALAGPLDGMFDFTGHGLAKPLFLDPATGEPAQGH
jgi:phospholipase C